VSQAASIVAQATTTLIHRVSLRFISAPAPQYGFLPGFARLISATWRPAFISHAMQRVAAQISAYLLRLCLS
jgi:hypothetical protein